MREGVLRERGSGLIIALSVLAMLAIMATTFITLMRLDTRMTAMYVDDLRCEMLARGALNYFRGILRDDLDRTWDKYENRDGIVGSAGSVLNTDIDAIAPGVATPNYGTPVCDDFWMTMPYRGFGLIYATGEWSDFRQRSFGASWDGTGGSRGVVGRYYDHANHREFDVWVARSRANFDKFGNRRVLHFNHPDAGQAIDFDGDGGATSGFGEEDSDADWYRDPGPFMLFAGDSYYNTGEPLTRGRALGSGLYWRWAVTLGVPHAGYLNLNTSGNLDGRDTGYLNNVGGIGLVARRSIDEEESLVDVARSKQLARLRWYGFPGEYQYATGWQDPYGKQYDGFPSFYNEVYYHPAQVSLEKLFTRDRYQELMGSSMYYPAYDCDLKVDRAGARELIAYRLGDDGKPGDGSDRYRVGWRRDGATYYKFLSPENPMGDDQFFGPNEVVEHDHSAGHPGTSAIVDILGVSAWQKIRGHVCMWSTDTILRGKIWPTEGPLPWRENGRVGDWRHIDILKRVNINIIGACGPEGLPGEDAELKGRWLEKRDRERDRLYFMLVAGMRFGEIEEAKCQRNACQFVASLADMVDRDRSETYYAAPDGSGNWALGMEKQPVINEVVFFSGANADRADYELSLLRLELYNPMENIPWIPDEDEVIDIRDYRLRVKSGLGTGHTWRLGGMKWFKHDDMNTRQGSVTTIGAAGMYGDPDDITANKLSWSRYLHIGWDQDFPSEITRDDLKSGLTFELWKPLSNTVPDLTASPGVETIDGVQCICVDRTVSLKLLPNYGGTGGPGWSEKTVVGCYRRWDPMNALLNTEAVADSDGRVHHAPAPIGESDRSNIIWCQGWYDVEKVSTLGRPNVGYADGATSTSQSAGRHATSRYRYWRHVERNFKIVDGDLPSIGWLGELMMHNCAQDGPLTHVHDTGQHPIWGDSRVTIRVGWVNQLDYKAKFDLFRPFRPAGVHCPAIQDCRTENLHMLDIFTVWDPSNDNVDNDGDGAIDDQDTGYQLGDRRGPEVRVFGKVDLNVIPRRVCAVILPDNKWATESCDGGGGFCRNLRIGRLRPRSETGTGYGHWGPLETIGDMLRADHFNYRPGQMIAGNRHPWVPGHTVYGEPVTLGENGFKEFGPCPEGRHGQYSDRTDDPERWGGDDDNDDVFDERDERDLVFTWVSNHLTTRSNVFGIDLVVDICEPPYYPEKDGVRRKLPLRTYKTHRSFARRQVVGVLDRSACLRIHENGECGFCAPVEIRMLRFTEDKRVF